MPLEMEDEEGLLLRGAATAATAVEAVRFLWSSMLSSASSHSLHPVFVCFVRRKSKREGDELFGSGMRGDRRMNGWSMDGCVM